MSKIIWLVVGAWILRSVWQAVKKAVAQAKAEIAAQKAREAGASSSPPPQQVQSQPVARPQPVSRAQTVAKAQTISRSQTVAKVQTAARVTSTSTSTSTAKEDSKAALLRMLASAGVSPSITKVVESSLDYDDDAAESRTDYDDDSDEDGTDYDDRAPPPPVVYPMPAPPVVYPMPAPVVVYAMPAPPVTYEMPDDRTSDAYNVVIMKDIQSHAIRRAPKRGSAHSLDKQSVRSAVLVRDSIILDTLLTRYERNPFFRKGR